MKMHLISPICAAVFLSVTEVCLAGTLDAPAHTVDMSGPKLIGEYEKNAIAADQKLNGKKVIVSGAISEITAGGSPSVTIAATKGGSTAVWGIRCQFANPAEIGKLAKGQIIRVEGTVRGVESYYVLLADASLRK